MGRPPPPPLLLLAAALSPATARQPQPLRQARRAACPAAALQPAASASSASAAAFFRSSPLPGALRPPVPTTSLHRLAGVGDYAWSLAPYASGGALALAALVAACPCCCVFARHARGRRRPPFKRDAGVGLHVAFALLSLLALLSSLVALEEGARADRAYSRARCAAYTLADVLVNGADQADLGPGVQGFIGFRRLTEAITAASTTYPGVQRSIREAQASLVVSPDAAYPAAAAGYRSFWADEHRREMQVTPFHCLLCSDMSLQWLSSSSDEYTNKSQVLWNVFSEAAGVIDSTRPVLQGMMNQTLTDITALYSLCFDFGGRLDGFFAWSDKRWSQCTVALRWLLAGSLVNVFLGVVCLACCNVELCPLIAWWLAYAQTAGIVALCAVLLPLAVFAHDADGLLRDVLTRGGVDAYAPSVLQSITARQRLAFASCVAPGGSGDIGEALNISLSNAQLQAAQQLRRDLDGVAGLRLNDSALDPFFAAYSSYGGGSYIADWNTSQTLGWRNEANGLDVVANSLHALSMEYWAFDVARAPPGCALATPFNASSDPAGFRCFLVSDAHPSRPEVEARYNLLTPDQLTLLLSQFRKARTASVALSLALRHADANGPLLQATRDSWQLSARRLNRAAAAASAGVAVPMVRLTGQLQALAAGGNCSAASDALLLGRQALGRDFVAAHLALSACLVVLALSSCGLTVLYCTLWGLRQRGAASSGLTRLGGKSDSESDGGRDAGSSDEEAELLKPLRV